MESGTEDFAKELRALKERSGLSYGALAKRAHMSTSTLHRYCNGDAVPTEFAPLERLARLCGASREETVALHRRWIVADEARRRGRTVPGRSPSAGGGPGAEEERGAEEEHGGGAAPAGSPGTTGPGTSEVPDPSPAAPTPAASTSAAPSPAAPSPVLGTDGASAGPGPYADPAPPQAPEAGTGGGTGTCGGTGAGGGTGANTDAGPLTVVAPPAPRRPAGDRSRRRVVLAVAAAAVVALTASAVLAGTLDSSTARGNLTVDNGHRAAPARPSLSVHPTGAVSSASPSSSPSSSSSSGTSSPSATASRTSTAPSLAARPGEHTAKRRRSGVPLTVDVRSHVWPHPCDQSYLVDRPPARVPPPPSPQDARGWVTALGGTPADRMMMELSVQGTSEEVVVLHALHVRIVEKGAPLPWTTYLMGDGCGGQMTPMSLDINLDAARPRVVPVAGQQGDREIPATDFPYKVSATDPQMLRVTAHTAGHSVRWYAELEWSSGDRRGTLLIDDRGRPFATSAAAGRPHYAYPLGGSGWLPVEYG